LLYNAPRAATCKAVGAVEVWALDQLTFRQVMQSSTTSQREKIRKFVQQVRA
jgi:cAMP-dependent protein kinase regulator